MKRVIVLCSLLCLASIVWGAEKSLLDQADAAFNQGRYDEAIAEYNAIIRAEPTNIRAYLQVGRAHAAKGRYDEAVAAFNKGLQQKPSNALSQAIYQELGVVYSKQGRNDEAIAALREATKLAPHNFHAQYMLGAAYLQKGLQREARVALEEALRLAKTSPGGKDLAPSIEAMLSYLPPSVPSSPTSPPPEKYKLTVQATPAESTIKFPNSKLEYRPGLEVEPGRYDLVITHEGYKPVRKQVTITTADVTLPVTLEPEKYKLTVQATPVGSTIQFENSQLEYRPGMDLAPGRYDLVVTREGYKPVRKQVTITTANVTLNVALESEKKYKLTVQATPAESTIKFPNSKLEYRPGLEVEPGRYDLVITHEGYKPVRKQVTITTADVTLPVTLEPEKYKLTVQATPVGSTIQFENSQLEYRPGMEVPVGRYELVVMGEGYKTARRTVTVNKVDVTLQVSLEPEKYKLTVQPTPTDSTVSLEKSKVKYRPGMEVRPGRYDVVVTRDGYKTAHRTVTVSNADVTLDVALEQVTYKLTVEATPADSTVKLDNSMFDYRSGLEVPPGRYDLILSREGYKTTRRQVTVSKMDVTLKVALEQEKYKLTVRATPMDSTVKLDNSNLEYRPGMEVTAGLYELTVSRDGYKPARHTITVSTADVTFDVALEREKTYKLTVQATPAESLIKFDNSKLEYRPGMELAPGRYELVVTREGYKPVRQPVTISTSDVTVPITLEPEKYKLTVRATPAESLIKFDNSKLEYRPGMELPPGRYELVVSREGYKPARQPVTISTSDVTLDVALEMIKYKLTVQVTPADSTIKFDNSKLEYRPGMELAPGRYDLVITRDGYKPARQPVTLSTADVTLPVTLDPDKYKLTVQVTPADSTIKFDNSKLEYRPGMELAPGRYDLVITHDGYKPARKPVTLSTADVTLDVALEMIKYKLTVQAVPVDSLIQFDNSKLEYRPGIEVVPGRYDLLITHDGYKPARKQVTLSTADVTLPVTLDPDKYKLTVQVTPADSTIKFDNSKLEYRPGMDLTPGRYDLVITHDGYKPARKQVMLSTADVTLDVALEMIKYKLTVQVTPADSTIKFDNSKLEYRPGMELAPGRYDLVITRDGYKPARQPVTLSTADVTLPVTLDPDKYKLTVQVTPADSTIKFDNSKLEYRPGMELAPGRYDLVITHDGYKPARQPVTLSTADVTLPVTLDPDKYKLTVQVTPADSTIKFDNSKLEYRPGMELAPGRYDLVITHDGYKPARKPVTLSTADVTLDVALEMIKYKLTVQAVPVDSLIQFDNSKLEYRPGIEVVPGRYDLLITHDGYKPARKQVTLSTADVTLPVTLDPDKYKLTVQVTPADSTIKFDNSKLEYRPGMDLTPGRYTLVVSREGYKPVRQPVTISTADVTLNVALELITYKLMVQVTPADSLIKFDNSKLEYRPGMELAPGRYDLLITRDGYKPARKPVTISTADVTLPVTLEADKYKLTVQVTPVDSLIKFDNSKLEYRPGMELAPGRYDLLITHDGYKPARRQVMISTADVTLDVALDIIKYKLTVQATPADSTVKFDNSKLEYSPGMDLIPGRYALIVSHEGYKPARKQVTISTADVTLDVALDVIKYKLTVRVTPADSTVKFDNSKVEYRPGVAVEPGRYEVVVTRNGYKPARHWVTISDADVSLDIALEPDKYKLTVRAEPAASTIKLVNSPEEYQPSMELALGRYEVMITHDGYKPARHWVTIHDADVLLDAALEPEKYKLTVRAEPADSTIKLTNSTEEYQPGMELASGRYEVVVERQGYKTDRREVTIGTADVTLDVALEPDKAPPKRPPAFGVDTRPPSIALKQESIPKNVGPTQARVIIIGHATDDSGVAEVTVNGKQAELGADGTFAVEILLRVGENVISVTALDINGNEAQETFTIYRQGAKVSDQSKPPTPPEIVILSPEGLRVGPREAGTTLRGRVIAPDGVVEVTVNDNAAALESDGTFSVGITLEVGENPIVVAAMDRQRHVTEQTFTITRPGSTLPLPPTRRLALIIGNTKYQVSPLKNAANDATDINDLLKKLGFETKLLTNATYQQMEDAIDSFRLKLRQGGVGLFYYAGHGVQIDGQNYLMPVDAPLQTAANVKYRSVPVNGLLERMADAGNELNIIILDACRENLFMREWRSVERGLAIAKAAQGSFIAYSTAPGDVALDGSGRNGVYTKHLLKYITRRGITVEELFKLVRNAVAEETKGKQIPWENSSLFGDFYFAGR